MSRRLFPSLLALAALASPLPAPAEGAEPRRVAAAATADTRAWAARIEGLVREGGLVLRAVRDDTLLPGRQHARYEQRYKGVPVVGGDLAAQVSGADVVSVFGTLYDGIDLDPVPAFSADRATDVIARLSGQPLGNRPELVVLPLDQGGFVLVYTLAVFTGGDRIVYSIDAHTGAVVEARSEIQTQSAVGHGRGVLGDDKKMSVRAAGGQFFGDDLLRPPLLETFDLQGSLERTIQFLNGVLRTGDSDLISDSDNDWADGPAVDAHTYSGYVYDYYFKRFGRRGLDGNDLRVRSVVHPVRLADYARYGPDVVGLFFVNAFYAGNGTMVFGEGLPAGVFLDGQNFKPFSAALDVVAHELTHGVTQFTSRLRGVGESGALNESFSDMMGTSAEFFFQPAGSGPLKADYQLGEDITTPGAVRSMDNPALFGQPDHYRARYLGPLDAGGIHRNCSISNQVYYLAIEGGTNRTSRLSVQGVGGGNREQIEKVMYRAFTLMMPSDADFATARVVTIQSARDLYGAGSPAERALIQAWTAVGVP
ncbi:MAG TPA: M4 family metallopeptidase [Vicinamibacteria bacterium]|nr:M4 family metallopeptidase [Vicinamibacteria bacterium]